MSPTGYTSAIDDNPEITMEQFTLRCARAFGALVHMRDDSMDAELPAEITPDTYHRDKIEEAKKALAKLSSMDATERIQFGADLIAKSQASYIEYKAKHLATKAAYDRMTAEIKAWNPHPDLLSLKRFMLEQLDTGAPYIWSGPDEKTPLQVWTNNVEKAESDILYHTKEWAKEQERARERNQWLQLLRQSLPSAEASNV